jgi:hypothetical protein
MSRYESAWRVSIKARFKTKLFVATVALEPGLYARRHGVSASF